MALKLPADASIDNQSRNDESALRLPLYCTKQFCNGPSEFENLLAGGETEKVLQNSDCAEISEGAQDDINKPGTQEIDCVQVLESSAPKLVEGGPEIAKIGVSERVLRQ